MQSDFVYVICSISDPNFIALANMCLGLGGLNYTILTIENNLNQIATILGPNYAQVYPTIVIKNTTFNSNQQIAGYNNCVTYLRSIQYKNNL